MKVARANERATRKGPADWFTGDVWVDEIVVGTAPLRLRAYRVSFAPGARTAWHAHPVGQTLHVLTGVGLVQLAGGPVEEIHPGDTVMIAPDERHWHGAAPGNTMVHLAMQEADTQGVDVRWFEHVSDTEYAAR